MADTKISALTEKESDDIVGTEKVAVATGSSNFRIALDSLVTWIKTQLAEFVTLDGIQILTHKTLTYPDINGIVVTVTGTVINYLDGVNFNIKNYIDSIMADIADHETRIDTLENVDFVTLGGMQTLTNKTLTDPSINGIVVTVTGAVINYLDGVDFNIKDYIDSIVADIADHETRIDTLENMDATEFQYEASQAASSTSITITADDINDGAFNIDPTNLIIAYYRINDLISTAQSVGDNVEVYKCGSGELDEIIFAVENDKSYHFVIRYKELVG
jgi:hypothetical protein